MGIALRLPKSYPSKPGRSVAVLLGLIMPLMWLSSTLLVYLILDLPFWTALLIGAIVTPTDPVVATAIVTGRIAEHHLPQRIRQIISAESGVNDGLAYLFVLLPILLLRRAPGEVLVHWLTVTLPKMGLRPLPLGSSVI